MNNLVDLSILHTQEMIDFLVDIWDMEGLYDWNPRHTALWLTYKKREQDLMQQDVVIPLTNVIHKTCKFVGLDPNQTQVFW